MRAELHQLRFQSLFSSRMPRWDVFLFRLLVCVLSEWTGQSFCSEKNPAPLDAVAIVSPSKLQMRVPWQRVVEPAVAYTWRCRPPQTCLPQFLVLLNVMSSAAPSPAAAALLISPCFSSMSSKPSLPTLISRDFQ